MRPSHPSVHRLREFGGSGKGSKKPAPQRKDFLMADEPIDTYDAEHIREALIADPRVNALDVQVSLAGEALVVTGSVPTMERRDAIATVLAELAPGVDVRNDVSLIDLSEPTGQEVVS